MNKYKGFTLIELIGVILLLTIISMIVFPIVLTGIKNTKKQLSEATKAIIFSGATNYITTYQNSFRKTEGNVYCITLKELSTNGNISSNMELQTENISFNSFVKVDVEDGKYKFSIADECETKLDIPGISLSVIGDPFNQHGWANADFYVNIVGTGSSYKYCMDDSICTPTVEIKKSGGTALVSRESATNYVCAQAINYEGQSEVVCSSAYKLDKTAPSITGVTDIEAEINTILDLKSGVTSTDSLSGVAGTFSYTPEIIDSSLPGVSNITYQATDLAGNHTEIKRKITILSSAPDITYAVQGNPINNNGWANDNFYVKATAIDNSTKGIKQIKYCYSSNGECTPTITSTSNYVNVLVNNESINNKICMQAIDNVNKESKVVCSDTYKLDKKSPTISSKVPYYVVVTPYTSVKSINYFNYANNGSSSLVGTSCKANGIAADNTSSLPIGEYTLDCTVTKENGKSASATISLGVSNCFSFASSNGNLSNYRCYQGNTGGYLVKSDVKIPYSINQYTVNMIGSSAFYNRKITSVDFSNVVSLTSIGTYAFYNNQISNVDFSSLSNLTSIGTYGFYMNQLGSVNLSPLTKLTSIGSYAFAKNLINSVNFTNLTKLTLLDSYAFAYNQLTNVNLSPLVNLTSISAGTFTSNQIQTVNLSNLSKVTAISSHAFSNNAMTSLNLSPMVSLTSIGSSAFYNNQLTAVTFTNLNKLTKIDISAFHTNQIASVNLSPLISLESIGSSAFYNNKITSVNFTGLSKLKIIDTSAFHTNQIASVNLSPLTSLESIGSSAFYNNKITNVNFTNNNNLSKIGDSAFAYNQLTSLNLSPLVNLTYLSGFNNNNLSSLNLSNLSKVQTLGYGAFDANKLTSVNLSSLVALIDIGANSFANNQLSSIDFSKNTNLLTIGDASFRMNNLTSVNFTNVTKLQKILPHAFSNNKISSISFSGLTNLTTIADSAFFRNKISNINLSYCTSLKELGPQAFGENYATNLNLGSGKNIISIGGGAFAGNSLPANQAWVYNRTATGDIDYTKLSSYGGTASSVSIPTVVTEIMDYAFKHEDLTSLDLRNNTNLKRIGILSFDDNKLSNLIFPAGNNITEIGYGAFSKNKLPESQAWIYARNADGTINNTILVSYGGYSTSISIPSSVIEITKYAFYWDGNVQTINFQNAINLTTIGSEAFNSSKLTSLDFTKNTKLTSIESSAFYNNVNMSTVKFGPSRDLKISSRAFNQCTSLRKIINGTGNSYDWTNITNSNTWNQSFVTGTIIHQNGNISVTAS